MDLEGFAERLEREARETYGALTLDELEALPTITQGQADDLKIDDGDARVWLCRCGIEDGMPFDNAVTVERRINGSWVEVAIWPAEG